MNGHMANEEGPEFLGAVGVLKSKVEYRADLEGFYRKGRKNVTKNDELALDEVENMLMDELVKTDLHYDVIGDEEFQRLLNCGVRSLEHGDVIEMQKEESMEEELEFVDEVELEEGEEGEGEEDDPQSVLADFIQELIDEAKANPDEEEDEEYLHQRICRGLKTREIEIQFRG